MTNGQTERLNTALAGRYRILRHLGEGGMATVYLAEDLKHDRRVAVKVLKPELAAVLGAERFVQEIKTTAALQHPHILPLFDSGTADGFLFYVMPFIDGETLRAKLDRETQLGVDEAVRIAREVADALDYAHTRGIVHRDVKPENIMLHGGHAMVADFGIALAVSAAAGGRMTETGLSLGTPHYMSPEQATAEKEITARSDVYSLGSVLYEMLTGNPPHTGASAQQVIMKIITVAPVPVTELRKSVPAHLAAAIAQSLEKLPADRFVGARAFADALANPAFATSMGATSLRTSPTVKTARLKTALIAMSVAVLALSITAVMLWRRPVPQPLFAQFALGLPDSVSLANVLGRRLAITPDGSRIVIVGQKGNELGLYIRRLDEPVAQLVRGTTGEIVPQGSSPTLSPDGQWIVFGTREGVKKISVAGGPAQLVSSGHGPTVGDHEVLVTVDRDGGLRVGSLNGHETRLFASPDTAHGVLSMNGPDLLPGNEHVLVTATPMKGGSDEALRIGLVSLASGAYTDLGISGFAVRYVEPGFLLFARAGGLVYAVPFSLKKRAVTGQEVLLLDQVQALTGGTTTFAVSDNGVLVYARDTDSRAARMFAVNLNGVARALPAKPEQFNDPRVSPDGRKVLVDIGARMGDGLWMIDIASGAKERITAPREGVRPEWTRDGTRVLFFRDSAGQRGVMSRSADRSRPDEWLVPRGAETGTEISTGPAHGWAALRFQKSVQNRDIFIAPMDSLGALRPFLVSPRNEIAPAISADGHLLAYASDESGKYEIYVQPIPGPGARVLVSVDGGVEPVWSPTGSTLYYRAQGALRAAAIATAPLAVQRRDSLFTDVYEFGSNHQGYSIFPDGRAFLMVRTTRTGNANIFAMLNWTQLLARQSAAAAP